MSTKVLTIPTINAIKTQYLNWKNLEKVIKAYSFQLYKNFLRFNQEVLCQWHVNSWSIDTFYNVIMFNVSAHEWKNVLAGQTCHTFKKIKHLYGDAAMEMSAVSKKNVLKSNSLIWLGRQT